MAYSKEKIIKMINLDEPDYQSIASKFAEEDISIINELTKDPDVSISSKAISILGWVDSDAAIEGIENGVKSDNPILKISAAQALKRKSEKIYPEESRIGEIEKADPPIGELVKPEALIGEFGKPLTIKDRSDKITDLLHELLSDNDTGVKKFALKAIPPDYSKKFEAKLKEVQTNENNLTLRNITDDLIDKT